MLGYLFVLRNYLFLVACVGGVKRKSGDKAGMEGGGLGERKNPTIRTPLFLFLRSLANAKFPLANTH